MFSIFHILLHSNNVYIEIMTEAQRSNFISKQFDQKLANRCQKLHICTNNSSNLVMPICQKSLKKKHDRLGSKFIQTSFPSINFDTGRGIITLKGQSCEHRLTQNSFQNQNIQQEQQQVSKKVAHIDRQYLMRNFPISYFENVDLLFKIIDKKKKFFIDTYKTQRKEKSKDCDVDLIGPQFKIQIKENMFAQKLAKREKTNKIRLSKKQINRNGPKSQEKNRKLPQKYKQSVNMTQHLDQKKQNRAFVKVFSERKFNKINENQLNYTQQIRQISDNRNTIHSNVKSSDKFRIKKCEVKESSEDEYIAKIATNNHNLNMPKNRQNQIQKKNIKFHEQSNLNRKNKLRQITAIIFRQTNQKINQDDVPLRKQIDDRKSQEPSQVLIKKNNKIVEPSNATSKNSIGKSPIQWQRHKASYSVGEALKNDDQEDKKTIKIGEDSDISFIEQEPIIKPIAIKSRNQELAKPKKFVRPIQKPSQQNINNKKDGKIAKQVKKYNKVDNNANGRRQTSQLTKPYDNFQLKKITQNFINRGPSLKEENMENKDNIVNQNQIKDQNLSQNQVSQQQAQPQIQFDYIDNDIQQIIQVLQAQQINSKYQSPSTSQLQLKMPEQKMRTQNLPEISAINTQQNKRQIITVKKLLNENTNHKEIFQQTIKQKMKQDIHFIQNAKKVDEIQVQNVQEVNCEIINNQVEDENLKKTPHFNYRRLSNPKNLIIKNIDDEATIIQEKKQKRQHQAQIIKDIHNLNKNQISQIFSSQKSNKNKNYNYNNSRVYKDTSNLSPSYSNVDQQQINDFYDQLVELGANQSISYRPKISNINDENLPIVLQHQQQEKISKKKVFQSNQKPINDQRSSMHSIDKAIILFTQSDALINSSSQALPIPSLNKKNSSIISIFSQNSEPQRAACNKRKKHATIIEQDQQNLMYQTKPVNMNQSLIYIDLNQKVVEPAYFQNIQEQTPTASEIIKKQQKMQEYVVSVNRIQKDAIQMIAKQSSKRERISQTSACMRILMEAKISNQSQAVCSEVSLLNLDEEQQKKIDKNMQMLGRNDKNSEQIQQIKQSQQRESEIQIIKTISNNPMIDQEIESDKYFKIQEEMQGGSQAVIKKKQKMKQGKDNQMKVSKSMQSIKKKEQITSKNIRDQNIQERLENQKGNSKVSKNQKNNKQKEIDKIDEHNKKIQSQKQQQRKKDMKQKTQECIKAQQKNVSQPENTQECIKASQKNVSQPENTQECIKAQQNNVSQPENTQECIKAQQNNVSQPENTQECIKPSQLVLVQQLCQLYPSQEYNQQNQINSIYPALIPSNHKKQPQSSQNYHLCKSFEINILYRLGHHRDSPNKDASRKYEVQNKDRFIEEQSNVNSHNLRIQKSNQQSFQQKQFDNKDIISQSLLSKQKNQLNQKPRSIIHTAKQSILQVNLQIQLPNENKINIKKLSEHEFPANQQQKFDKNIQTETFLDNIIDDKQKISQEKYILQYHQDGLIVETKQEFDQKNIKEANYNLDFKQYKSQQQIKDNQLFQTIQGQLQQLRSTNNQPVQKITRNLNSPLLCNSGTQIKDVSQPQKDVVIQSTSFNKKKQNVCAIIQQYMYSDQSISSKDHTEQVIAPIIQASSVESISKKTCHINQIQKVKLQLHDPSIIKLQQQKKLQVRKDISTNTFDLLDKDGQQIKTNFNIQKKSPANISNYTINHDERILQLKPDNNFELNYQIWNMVIKIFRFLNSDDAFLSRLVDSQSVWLFNFFKKQANIQRISLISSQLNVQQKIKQGLEKMLASIASYSKFDTNNIKTIMEALTGMPVLLLKQSCYHKLDNLYRHSNIFGFTFGKEQVWRIVGTLQSKKNPQEKRVRLEKISNKQIVQITWRQFLDDFRHSFISGFSHQYHLRSLKISNKKSNDNPSFKLNVCNNSSSKTHCIMGITSIQDQIQLNGKMLVYIKTESQKKGQQCYKYLGSGDICLVSMKLKNGQYIIVVELDQKGRNIDLSLSMGCDKNSVILEQEKQ